MNISKEVIMEKRWNLDQLYLSFQDQSFLNDIDFVILMVGHDEIKENMRLLEKKIILDTKNICSLNHAYKL